jgi:5,10-methylenetetrahydrofolate reductase
MSQQSAGIGAAVVERLKLDRPLVAVELRPPKAGLSRVEGMDVWIDMYHSIRRLASGDTLIFLTDNAVGEAEEENLQHLTSNLAGEVHPAKVVPFLTCKHPLDYCLVYAARAASFGFQALTVLGGDRSVGPPRCVEYAYQLRRLIRERVPSLSLGGWVNPHRDPVRQVDYLLSADFTAEFYLTQIVSHHSIEAVEAFVDEARRRGVAIPGVFGVFLYRSANPETLQRLERFFPVPATEIAAEFAAGLSAEEICARSVRALREVGVDKVYVSNLGFRRPEQRYRRLMEALG